ncbi:acyl CoA binding protein-domain-containing protein [Dichotomocladium elegans]|nr:acyl CoA binding protein-domain-containing protein [Dichotomocladium elegans]
MIPPHYSDRYVIQRYNKALEIVQHLPANSTFQPTRDEKLELYGYYKQATYGNVDAARPGLFDVVGRAKWDSWKKLEGMDRIDARHHYTETLLRAAREAYKKNSGRPIAEQIIHEFGLMQQQLTGHDSKEHKKNTITYDSPTVQEGQ